MTIFLAPSETKNKGGKSDFKLNNLSFSNQINRSDFIKKYELHLKDEIDLEKLFSTQNDTQEHLHLYQLQKTLPAMKRYTGVAYDYLDFNSLNSSQKEFVQQHVIIFSNLYGVLRPLDEIPYYKLKQGAKVGDTTMHAHYKKELKFLEELDDEWLNLSANYYEKFFTPQKNHYDIKFLKRGKVVSHWAKAYRGLLLRECALYTINSIEKLLNHHSKVMKLIDIKSTAKKTTLIYEVE